MVSRIDKIKCWYVILVTFILHLVLINLYPLNPYVIHAKNRYIQPKNKHNTVCVALDVRRYVAIRDIIHNTIASIITIITIISEFVDVFAKPFELLIELYALAHAMPGWTKPDNTVFVKSVIINI